MHACNTRNVSVLSKIRRTRRSLVRLETQLYRTFRTRCRGVKRGDVRGDESGVTGAVSVSRHRPTCARASAGAAVFNDANYCNLLYFNNDNARRAFAIFIIIDR